jgi:hypothetical protein
MDAARRTRREAKPKLDVGARVARLFSDGWHVGIIEALSAAATASVRFDDGQLIHSMRLDGMHAVPDDEALAAFIASDLAKKKPLADAQVAAMEAKRKRKAQTPRRVLSRWMQLWREQKGKTLDLSVLLAAEEGAQFAMFDRAEIISTEWRKVIVQRILEPEVGFVLHDVHGVVLDEVDTPKGVLLDAHDIEGMPYAYGQYYNFVEGGAEAVPPSPFSPHIAQARTRKLVRFLLAHGRVEGDEEEGLRRTCSRVLAQSKALPSACDRHDRHQLSNRQRRIHNRRKLCHAACRLLQRRKTRWTRSRWTSLFFYYLTR